MSLCHGSICTRTATTGTDWNRQFLASLERIKTKKTTHKQKLLFKIKAAPFSRQPSLYQPWVPAPSSLPQSPPAPVRTLSAQPPALLQLWPAPSPPSHSVPLALQREAGGPPEPLLTVPLLERSGLRQRLCWAPTLTPWQGFFSGFTEVQHCPAWTKGVWWAEGAR